MSPSQPWIQALDPSRELRTGRTRSLAPQDSVGATNALQPAIKLGIVVALPDDDGLSEVISR